MKRPITYDELKAILENRGGSVEDAQAKNPAIAKALSVEERLQLQERLVWDLGREKPVPTPSSFKAMIEMAKNFARSRLSNVQTLSVAMSVVNYKSDEEAAIRASAAFAGVSKKRVESSLRKRRAEAIEYTKHFALDLVRRKFPEATLETLDEFTDRVLEQMETTATRQLDEAEIIATWVQALEPMLDELFAQRREDEEKDERPTELELVVVENKCSSRPKCNKPVYVKDEQGRWWCKKHAHRRGLLKREEIIDG